MSLVWWMQLPYYIQEEYQIYLMGRNKMSFEQLQRFRRLALGQDNDHTATPAAGWPLHKESSTFRSRKIFRILLHSYLFSPNVSMKFSNYSKIVRAFFFKFSTFILTPKGAPACAMASKPHNWDLRNIAKISPKLTKKRPFLDFFAIFSKLSIRFEQNFLVIQRHTRVLCMQ